MTKDYKNDFLAFFQDLYRVEGAYGPKPLTPPFLVEFLGHAFNNGIPTARNILEARSKKEGKSALAGAVALFIASRESYAEVVIAAADKDQAHDRVLRAAKFACENGPLAEAAKVYKNTIELNNKSTITAIPMDWQSSAGGNHSCVIFDELHAWIYENNRRLFDELLPPPTQPHAVRWIASYAGYLGESELLKEWWDRGLDGELISENIPLYMNHNVNLLALIDTGPESWRMPWMSEKYINEIRESERPNTFNRLWLNEWVNSESAFVPIEAWNACFNKDIVPLAEGDNRTITLGVDASTTRDMSALVGTWFNVKTNKVEVIYVKGYKPKKGWLRKGKATIDLEALRDEIIRLHNAGNLGRVLYDPYQMGSIALNLERKGIQMVEFPQTAQRVESDQQLYDCIIGGAVQHYNHPELNKHIRNAIARETPRGFRLDKEKTTLKIDMAVALSMSNYGCRKYALHGTLHTFPYFLDLAPGWGYYAIESVRQAWVVSNDAPRVHAPGVTSKNCRWKNGGCPACIDEYDAAGTFKEDDFFKDPYTIYTSVKEGGSERNRYQPTPQDQQAYRARAAFKEGIKNRLKDK